MIVILDTTPLHPDSAIRPAARPGPVRRVAVPVGSALAAVVVDRLAEGVLDALLGLLTG
ncbi:hypothetical protein [Saccharothrix coeruleofusca]|uniref:Uncharacterized protein n=1 Tax=Saccharothrix coeruleofusca TaxID=33919 RepID=A0A918APY5_9PSEU|nr:hypothetical protein [Saccharothrix coeruleofusca]MBP2335054.1 hypothetical protein [Saccharothrix coeruleofusca]GGP68838.1 hypothetical protein GCM10010185_47260 [Saccharothrix coeruleofusca]